MENVNGNLIGVTGDRSSEAVLVCENKTSISEEICQIPLVNIIPHNVSSTNIPLVSYDSKNGESFQAIANGESLLDEEQRITKLTTTPTSTVVNHKIFNSLTTKLITQQETGTLVQFNKDSFPNLVFTTIPSVSSFSPSLVFQRNAPSDTASIKAKGGKSFCVATLDEVEETIRKHSEDTFSHFVVAKKTKAFGSPVSAIDLTTRFRVHWQSRDLTSTEECAVQIPFEGIPFIYIGEKAFMCHLGRCKPGKHKDALASLSVELSCEKKHRSRLVKKQGCPAKVFVKHIAKFPEFSISSNTEYLRTQMSQKLKKALQANKGELQHITQYVGTLPGIHDHDSHDIGEETPVREPIDPVIRDKIVELAWQYGDSVLPSHLLQTLEYFVEQVLFKDKKPPSKRRRRFYPNEKDIANYIYKAKMLTKMSLQEIAQLNKCVECIQKSIVDIRASLSLENGDTLQSFDEVSLLATNKLQVTSITSVTDYRIVFCCQSLDQQRLLKKYGKHALLLEITESNVNVPFPVFGVFVATNVDFQLVYLFMVQSRSNSSMKHGLAKLTEWNPDWCPKFLIVDYFHERLSLLDQLFPKCSILVSETSRLTAWYVWLSNPVNANNLAGDKDNLIRYLENIADSHTEDTLNKAAQALENSEVWRLSENLREWFSTEWLSEAKRWVVGYHMEEYISYRHLQNDVDADVEAIKNIHINNLKNRKITDFVKIVIGKYIPGFYQLYVDRNVEDYRKQCLMGPHFRESPSYLLNKPSTVVKHLMTRIKEIEPLSYIINQIQPGIFIVRDEGTADNAYSVSFGDATSLPSCACIDWMKLKLPCVHMVAIFQNIHGWSMDMLSPLYLSNPNWIIDFSCFDRAKENVLISTPELSVNEPEPPGNKIKSFDSTDTNKTSAVNKHLNLPAIEKFVSNIDILEERNTINEKIEGNSSKLNNLATDCNKFCKELSSAIHHVDNSSMLQKVKLDLQFMLNDVKLELSKVIPVMKHEKKRSFPLSRPNLSTSVKKSKKDIECHNESNSSINESVSASDPGRTDINISCKTANMCTNDSWVFDAELNVKLLRDHRESILKGETISIPIMHTVQKILQHQFNDVNGFLNFEFLEKLSSSQSIVNNKKILQIHRTDDNHWAASARVDNNVRIYCCTLASKAKIIQQVLKMVNQTGLGESILFIARSETDDVAVIKDCGLYAIAYCVAFAFDIEARNLIFEETGMRSHLVECLEDMCFSMFPLRT